MPIPDAVLPPEPMPEPKKKKEYTIDEIYAACNASLACGIQCPLPLHTEQDCQECGNADCVQAAKGLEEIWKDS